MLRLDANTNDAAKTNGEVKVLLVERAPAGGWINLHDCFRLLPGNNSDKAKKEGGDEFLWRSERDGYGHLYAVPLEPLAVKEGPKTLPAVAGLEPGGIACKGSLRRLTVGLRCSIDGAIDIKGGSELRLGFKASLVLNFFLSFFFKSRCCFFIKFNFGFLPCLYFLSLPSSQGPGAYVVEDVVGLHNGQIYYMGTSEGNWCERHLFQVPVHPQPAADASKAPQCLTSEQPGFHNCLFKATAGAAGAGAAAGAMVVDTHSRIAQPPIVKLYKLSADSGSGAASSLTQPQQLFDAAKADARVAQLGLQDEGAAPQLRSFASTDGQVRYDIYVTYY